MSSKMGAEATPTPLDLDDEVDALPNSWKPFGNRFQLAVVFFLGFLFGTALKLANSRQQLLLFTPPTTKVLDRPIVDGRPWPRDPELSTTGCQQMDTFAVALVSSLDTKYQDLARSALDSWGQYFPHKLIFVMGEVNSTSVPDAELRALTRDGFDGVDIQKITLEVSSGENNKPYIWKLAQHLFVEAAKRIMLAFPDVQYYVMVDADTTLRPHCLGNLLDFFPHNQVPMAFGNLRSTLNGLTLYGGAGNIWNAAAAEALDIDHCLQQTMVGGEWLGYNSDQRLPLCFQHFKVALIPVNGMFQLSYDVMMKSKNERQRWYPLFGNHQCTISMHRVAPEVMQKIYREDRQMLGC